MPPQSEAQFIYAMARECPAMNKRNGWSVSNQKYTSSGPGMLLFCGTPIGFGIRYRGAGTTNITDKHYGFNSVYSFAILYIANSSQVYPGTTRPFLIGICPPTLELRSWMRREARFFLFARS